MAIEWNDSLKLGIGEIDNQHKKLVEMVQKLGAAMKEGKGANVAGDIFNDLIKYTDCHFKYEEDIFSRISYELKDEHVKHHQELVNDVMEFKAKFDKSSVGIALPLMSFLEGWLKNHILVDDMKYVDAFKSNGIN